MYSSSPPVRIVGSGKTVLQPFGQIAKISALRDVPGDPGQLTSVVNCTIKLVFFIYLKRSINIWSFQIASVAKGEAKMRDPYRTPIDFGSAIRIPPIALIRSYYVL